ncbi:hypothetical protein CQW23_23670 [Capsicum baccatum]|uniref:Uncharacterized protein n=1 Tax=Capsicum baccatum TaxID=33114 RepID=A0A2G2VSL2_CAPBA|nr:hypothetical protein CQW23_23670 [Capsicum baccatum]
MLWQNHAKKDKKKESGSKKRGSNSPRSKSPAKRRRIAEAIFRDELPKVIGYSDLLNVRYTTTDCFFKVYIDKAYVNYYNAEDAVYAKYQRKRLGILSSSIDAQYHRLRYASILCKYGYEKAENGYFSDNDDPPRPSSNFAPKQTDRVLHIQ